MANSNFVKHLLEEKEPEPDRKSFTKERQHTAQAFALHLDYRDNRSSEGVAWSHFARYKWHDLGSHERLRVVFGGVCGLEITGHNLKQLEAELRSGQLNGIKETVSGKIALGKSEGTTEPLITGVKAYPDFDALFESLIREGEEDEHETGHAGRIRGR